MAKTSRDLDLRKLEVFYWVAELRSFSLAAEHFSLRQPTVTAHVQSLEQQLGCKLFRRSGGRFDLTSTGWMLYEQAGAVLKLKNQALAALDRIQGKVEGELRLGGSNVPGEYILPGVLGSFVARFPDVRPVLRIGDSAAIVAAILDGTLELGFTGFRTRDERLRYRKTWQDEMIVAVPANHRWAGLKQVALQDLGKEPFISREGGSGTLRSFLQLVVRRGEEPERFLKVGMELGSTAAVKEALMEGFGFSVLSRAAIRREVQQGLIKEVRVKGLDLVRPFYQVTHRERPLAPVPRAFVQFLNRAPRTRLWEPVAHS
ncbi:MAG: selenium metabolism-associated LysR family transcriptional regulator [Deltaproteobacteria bacterium]|nr:selenium metabolism-associated LysR family transcriptional regulator [Deltaproteobacteria bacterium]